MENSKLISVISVLEKREVSRFKKYLCSPLYNHREVLSGLFDYLLKEYKKKTPCWDKATIYAHLFPDSAYDDANFHLLFSDLLRQLEQFIMVDQYLIDENEAQLRLLAWYRKRRLHKHFYQTKKKLDHKLEKQAYRNLQYLQMRSSLLWEEYQAAVTYKPSGELPLEQMIQLTDMAYYAQKLRQLVLIKSQQAIYAKQYNIIFQENLYKTLNELDLSLYPVVDIYLQVNMLLDGAFDRTGFLHFINQLIQKRHFFKPIELRELFFLAINWCIKKVNGYELSYFQEMNYLYKIGFQYDYLLENGKISRFAYYNAVAAALQLKDYEWVENFIHQYKDKLDEAYQDSTFNHNLARFEYERGNYDQAQRLLQEANYQDVLFNLSAKTLLLKIYYENYEHELLEAHLDAMKNFIRRKKIIGYHQVNYQNLIRLTQKLLRLRKTNASAVESLKQEILAQDVLTEREWLLKQL